MKKSNRLSLLALEPRLVFDGAIALTQPEALQPDALHPDNTTDTHDSWLTREAAWLGDTAAPSAPREVVIVDAALPDLGRLLAALPKELEVLQINAGQDGLSQVLALLQGREGLSAIHILTHGQAGEFQLGTTRVNAAELQADSALWQQLGQHLSADGDLLVYGCDVAAGQAGQAFITELAHITGADVAASTNTTGMGGDWTLERQTGDIAAQSLAASEWQGHLLTPTTLSVTGNVYNESSSLAGFVVSGFQAGNQLALSVEDITTTGMNDGAIKYTLNGGTTWLSYTQQQSVVITSDDITASSGKMFVTVSTTPEQGGGAEGAEKFALKVVQIGAESPPTAIGESTLVEDNSGVTLATTSGNAQIDGGKFVATSAATSSPTVLVDNVRVNEADGAYLVFTVTARENQSVQLALSSLGATVGTDTGSTLQYFNGTSWVDCAYNASTKSFVFTAPDGVSTASYDRVNVQVRVAVNQDTSYEVSESVYLRVGYGDGATALVDPTLPLALVNPSTQATANGIKLSGANYTLVSSPYYLPGTNTVPGPVMPRFQGDFQTFTVDNLADGKITTPVVWAGVGTFTSGRVLSDTGIFPTTSAETGRTKGFITWDSTLVLKLNNESNYIGFWLDDTYVGGATTITLSKDGVAVATINASDIALLPSDSGFVEIVLKGGVTYDTFTATGLGFGRNFDNISVGNVTGIGTILDNGTGDITTGKVVGGIVELNTTAAKNDDRTLSVDNLIVNEGPTAYATFNVKANAGEALKLSLASGTATVGTDTVNTTAGNQLQYFNGAAWVDYVNGSTITVPGATPAALTSLLVRVQITNDLIDEKGGEDFTLTATYTNNNRSATGTGTIYDKEDLPAYSVAYQESFERATVTPGARETLANAGVVGSTIGYVFANPSGFYTPAISGGPYTSVADGAYAIVSSIDQSTMGGWWDTTAAPDGDNFMVVNGTGPSFAFYQSPTLSFVAPNTTYTVSFQVFDTGSGSITPNLSMIIETASGSPLSPQPFEFKPGNVSSANNWITYTSTFTTGTQTDLRMKVVSNAAPGDGNDFYVDNFKISMANPAPPLVVNDVRVNESAGYAVFTVSAVEGEKVRFDLANGTATVGTDTSSNLQYFDPNANGGQGAWLAYIPETYITVPSNGNAIKQEAVALLVRVAITADSTAEGAETFTLQATYENTFGGSTVTATGTATIVEDGSGELQAFNDKAFAVGIKPTSIDLLANDQFVPGANITLSTVATGTTAKGTISYDPLTGKMTYVAHPSEVGSEVRVTYLVSDGTHTDTAVVTIQVDYQGAVCGGSPSFFKNGGFEQGVPVDASVTWYNIPGSANNGWQTTAPDNQVEIWDGGFLGVSAAEGGHFAELNANYVADLYQKITVPAGSVIEWSIQHRGRLGTDTASVNFGSSVANATSVMTMSTGNTVWQKYSGIYTVPAGQTETYFVLRSISADSPNAGNGNFIDDVQIRVLSAPCLPISVNNSAVNEASPYAVFTVSALESQSVVLSLGSTGTGTGHATLGTDTGTQLQYFDGTNWVDYTPGQAIRMPRDADNVTNLTNLLVRVAITADTESDNGETFTLTATYVGETESATGTATIRDDGTGTVYSSSTSTNTVNGMVLATPVTLSMATSDVANTLLADDDRPLSVNNVVVNEGSPYAVFTVGGKEGQYVKLELASTTTGTHDATLGTDTGTALQYWNGTAWTAYTPGSFVKIPNDGDSTPNEAANLLVRVAIVPDSTPDTGETFLLKTSNTGGTAATGTGTIVDEGNGVIYTDTNPLYGRPVTSTQNLDDDRALKVNSVWVNEASPYAVFTVRAIAGDVIQLTLGTTGTGTGHATLAADTGNSLQYFDGNAWVPYVSSAVIPTSGELLVRVAILNDANFEGAETFVLTATCTAKGLTSIGTGTILDDGTGSVFKYSSTTTSVPLAPTEADYPALNDDRELSVSSITVNEGSPYAVFTVTAVEGQTIVLNLASGSATVGQDTGTQLQYFNGTAWVDYTPGQAVAVPAGGTSAGNEAVPLLVRVAITQDANYEQAETFTLTATYTSNERKATGTGTIVDDGTGTKWSFATANEPGTPVAATGATLGFDDDRPLGVTGTTVGEASGQVYWTVTGEPGQWVTLAASSGTAVLGTDTAAGTALEVFNGTAWVPYTAALALPASGELHVRLAVVADNVAEAAETLILTASNTAGTGFTGTSTIVDVGPVIAATEKPLAVVGQTVNEASPYLVFTVSGQTGQTASLTLQSGTATVGADTGTTLQYFNGTGWVNYDPATPPALMGTAGQLGQLLVRVAVNLDAAYEGEETLVLKASTAGGLSSSGVGAIVDDGTGAIFLAGNNSATPSAPTDSGYPTVNNGLTDLAAPPSVNSFTVNEASPYAVFTVGGVPGAGVTLTLAGGTATADVDYVDSLQVFDPATNAWVTYDPATAVVGVHGTLLVRVALVNDAPFEGAETFTLTARYNTSGPVYPTNTTPATGTATVIDDGTGLIFLTQADNPDTLLNEAIQGVNALGLPVLDRLSVTNDDRTLSVNNMTVNEGSPYAVFTVTAVEGQALALGLVSGTAMVGQDTGTQLQYYNGTSWVDYIPGTPITVPSGGTGAANEAVALLVRVAITPDLHFEVEEQFALQVSYASNGLIATGTGTIKDDGTGNVFGPGNTDGLPDLAGENGVPAGFVKDDDRPLTVTGTVVNESSPWVTWSVAGLQGQQLSLALGSGTATVGTDTGTQLQYFNGSTWVNYTPGNTIVVPGTATGEPGSLVVRLEVKPDSIAELSETLDLQASNVGGAVFAGTSAIQDTGGVVVNSTAEPLAINNLTVNEASPYAVFKVSGNAGQTASLSLQSGTATVGVDTGTTLQYYNPGTSQWVAYNANSPPALFGTTGQPGQLLVRVAVLSDSAAEGAETFTLTATTGGLSTVGVGTIVDDGTGTMFSVTNATGVPETPGTNGLPPLRSDMGSNPVVNSVQVNEASPYVVFTVQGIPGAGLTLALQDGSAEPQDHGSTIEVFDPVQSRWVAYGSSTLVPTSGELLVRVAIVNDAAFEGAETFDLVAIYNNLGVTTGVTVGGIDSGTATILDDGTGLIFMFSADSPGVNALGDPVLDQFTLKNDDSPVTVNNVEVNEASPYLVWTVGGKQGQYVKLAVASGTATVGTDTETQLQYWNGQSWMDYTAGTFVKVPGASADASGQLLVRLAVTNDFLYEDRETLTLTATNTGGTPVAGVGAIRDDGQGLLFGPDNTTGTPDTLSALGLNLLDDDRVAAATPKAAVVPVAAPEVAPVPSVSNSVSTVPAVHVQTAVAAGREAVSLTSGGATAAVVAERVMGSRTAGMNEMARTDALIDRFDRPTDPNLFVLVEVKDTRAQASAAMMPAYEMQSGLLMEEISPQNSVGALVKISQSPTSADQTLAELMEDKTAEQALARAQQEPDEVSLGEKLAAHLAASRQAIKLDAQERQTLQRGQMAFTQQLGAVRNAHMARRAA